MTHFRERQVIRGWYRWMVVVNGVLGVGMLVCWLLDASEGILSLVLIGFLTPELFLLSVCWATVTVFDDRLEVRHGGWWVAKRIALHDVVSCESLTWDFQNQGPLWHNRQLVNGCGMPRTLKGASKGVLVATTDGKATIVFSDRPDELLQVIETARRTLQCATAVPTEPVSAQ